MQPGSVRQQRKESQDMESQGGSSRYHRAQDRDIEQRYATLVTPIRDLTKNFEVDIVAFLDQYLDELSQTPITYQDGEASINFTQAAFLIQGSAFVYSKKVEYLYALVQKVAMEMAHGSSKNQDTQDGAKEPSNPAPRRKKEDTQYKAHEEMELADNLDDVPTPRQAARNQAVAAQKDLFRRQRHKPLSMVVFDNKKDIKLHDCKQDVVGFKVDYRLLSGDDPFLADVQDLECGRGDGEPSNLTANAEDASSLGAVDDSTPGSPLPEPEDLEPIPFCGDIAAFEECPSKPDMQESCPSPVPPVRQSPLARRIKEERTKNEMQAPQPQHILLIRRLHDPMEEVPSKDKPLALRRRNRKRAHDDASDTDSVKDAIVPVATLWVKQGQFPHLLAKELQLQKKGEVVPGGERFLRETLEALKQMDKDSVKKEGFEETVDEDDADTPGDGDLPAHDDDDDGGGPNIDGNDIDIGAFADAELPAESAQGLPPTPDEPPENSYENLVHNYMREYNEPMSEFQLSDLQKRVADWETRIRPLLDMEEERETYNIRTYCNRVLDHFSDAPSKQTLRFSSICKGKPVWEVPRYFASTLQLANSYNVELETDGVMEEGMDTLQLTLLSRKQHFHELEEFDSSNVTGATPSQTQPTRKGKQARKRVAASPHPEDPSDVLRENPVVPDPDFCVDPRLPPAARSTTARAKTRMRVLASLAEDSSEDENCENVVAVA